jgi:hypothetical protein
MMKVTTMTTLTTASLNRSYEFKKCCAIAMGFEWVDDLNDSEDDGTNDQSGSSYDNIGVGIQLINLLDGNHEENGEDQEMPGTSNIYAEDTWMDNAVRIRHDLTRMSLWIQSKASLYVGLDMQDGEASLIQSTVTTFAATTASEIETLREMNKMNNTRNATSNHANNLINHRSGIVQILLMDLQDKITSPFSKLQKQRTRIAVHIWQHPLECRLYNPKQQKTRRRPATARTAAAPSSGTGPGHKMQALLFDDDDGGDDDDDSSGFGQVKDQRFYPRQQQQNYQHNDRNFIEKYTRRRQQKQESSAQFPPPEPDFVQRLEKRRRIFRMTAKANNSADFGSASTTDDRFSGVVATHDQNPEILFLLQQQQRRKQEASVEPQPVLLPYQEQLANDLQEETMQLATTMIATSDLDSVQKMEQKMVEITTLIGQFSNLVQEQQEQIISVHESAVETKENITKGQENLVDAADRTKQSKHYKAMIIFAMGCILLFFHILRN